MSARLSPAQRRVVDAMRDGRQLWYWLVGREWLLVRLWNRDADDSEPWTPTAPPGRRPSERHH